MRNCIIIFLVFHKYFMIKLQVFHKPFTHMSRFYYLDFPLHDICKYVRYPFCYLVEKIEH